MALDVSNMHGFTTVIESESKGSYEGDIIIVSPAGVDDLNNLTTPAIEPAVAKVTAQDILDGFKYNKNTGEIELTLPKGVTIQEAGEILNASAKDRQMEKPVFYTENKETWSKIEANQKTKTEAGKTYKFSIPTDSVDKTRAEQEEDHGTGAPLGAIAIAEACHRLNTQNEGTLFKDANGHRVWVCGSASGFALFSFSSDGVCVYGYEGDFCDISVAFAPLASSRN